MAKLNINGTTHDVQAEADTPLLWVIREQVGLTGTKFGCGVAQCGSCVSLPQACVASAGRWDISSVRASRGQTMAYGTPCTTGRCV